MTQELSASGVPGLANGRGNLDCWMNSTLQCFAQSKLAFAVLHERSASAGRPTLLGELQLALTAMRCRGVFELVTLRNLLGECVLLNVCVPNG